MRRILLPILLILLAGAAQAEDFTGFYAGLNAGYVGREKPATALGDLAQAGARSPGPDLPPSAREAAASMRSAAAASFDPRRGR